MTKILYIPLGVYLELPTKDQCSRTEIYEETYAYANKLPTPEDCIEYMCRDYNMSWLIYRYNLPEGFTPIKEEFEIIYD